MKKLLFFALLFSLSGLTAQSDWNVYVFIAEECPICNYMGKPLADVSKKYEGKVSFHAVFPLKKTSLKTAQAFKEQYGLLDFETLLDRDHALTRKLGARITPEVVVTDGAGEILYRGRINSAYYAPGKMKHRSIKHDLDEVLGLLTSGKTVAQPWPAAVGCYITMNANQ